MNQPLHQSLEPTITKPTKSRGPSRSKRRSSAIIAFSTLALSQAEDIKCPPGSNGWASTKDCTTYFWCSAGSTSGVTYECQGGMLFDPASSACAYGYECKVEETPAPVDPPTDAPVMQLQEVTPGEQLAAMSEEAVLNLATAPTNYPTKLGPPIYYGDFRTSSCRSAAATPESLAAGVAAPPDWLTEEVMFQSKEECCMEMFGWAPIENCLGPDWIETNYVRGSRSPTLSPSYSPTGMPSGAPTVSFMPSSVPTVVASDAPSVMPSLMPSSFPSEAPSTAFPSESPSRITGAPTMAPSTAAPTTLFPTMAPSEHPTDPPTENIVVVTGQGNNMQSFSSNIHYQTESQSRPATSTESIGTHTQPHPNDPMSFLVELLGWANSDLSEDYNTNLRPTKSPTKRPTTESFAISEIILPVAQDATVSETRQALNFGNNQALAVDGGSVNSRGDGLGERFDSLLKFDIGMIDRSRPIDRAVLRIYALADCLSGGTFVTTTETSWDQQSVNWISAPMADGYEIGTIGSVSAQTWYELDMLPALTWSDTLSAFSPDEDVLSVRIWSSASGRCMYSSMESGQAKAPYMSVRYGMNEVIQEFSSSVLNAPPVTGQFLVLRSTDDATLDGSNSMANLGMESTLKVSFDMSSRGITDVLIRFDLSEMGGAMPVSAVLSLYTETDCPSAGTIMSTEGDSSWSESDVTWSTAPSYKKDTPGGGFNLGTYGQVTSHKWYGFDVVQAVGRAVEDGNDAITFRISTAMDGECTYSSREAGRDPKMMVAF